MGVRLSIIIPTKDGAVRAKIPECEGVEVIVVKGVSPVGKARNEGLRRARGEYIAWVDADDEVSEEWLGEILGAIDLKGRLSGVGVSSGAGVGSDVITFDAELVGWEEGRQSLVWGEKHPSVEKLMEAVCHDIARTSALWLYVTKRKLWEGLAFNEEISIIEDFLLLPEVLKRAHSVTYLPRKLYRYFCNPKSICHENNAVRERRVVELKEQRRMSFPPGRYRKASQLCMAVAHYLVAARVRHRIDGYETDEWRKAAAKGERWMLKNLPRVLIEVVWHARIPLRERLAWTYRCLSCAFRIWGLQRLLWRLRHG